MRKKPYLNLLFAITALIFASCTSNQLEEINVAYIGPLSVKAIDMGQPAKEAIELSIHNYNKTRKENQPKINFFYGDDKWEGKNAVAIYDSINEKNNLDVVFISNTEGTIALQDKAEKNNDLLINPLNSDNLLSKLNNHTIKVAKRTEEANQILGLRMLELGLKKTAILYYPNDFMTRAAYSIQEILKHTSSECEIIPTKKDDTNFVALLKDLHRKGFDGYAFLGYSNFGYAMKQARNIGISAPFFGSTTLLDPNYFKNSNGHVVGTECTYFQAMDGNYVLAQEFLKEFRLRYDRNPTSIWPAMQAYDASEILIKFIRNVNEIEQNISLTDYLRNQFYELRYYQGVCGNISMGKDLASKGIYFSLYTIENQNNLRKVKR